MVVRVHQTPHFSKNAEHCFCHQNLFITYRKTIYYENFEVHLRSSRVSASTLKLAKFPEPSSLWSKLQNCRTELIVRSFESSWRNKDTLNVPNFPVSDTYKVIHKKDNCRGHFVFVYFLKILDIEYYYNQKAAFLVKSFRMSIRWALYDNFEISTL